MPKRHLNTLYYSLICPYLTYGIILWGAASHVHLSKLIIMKIKSVRIITGAHYRAHTTPIFKHLHFLKLVDLYQLQVNKYVLSFLKVLLPSSLKHIFTLSQNQHGHNTRHSTAYKLMVQKTRTLAACIIQMGPQTWNLLPYDIYMCTSLLISCASFSSRFKRSTLEGYDD